MDDLIQMETIPAIKHVAKYFGISSMYRLASDLSGDGVNVQPIQISNYLRGRKMSKKVADRFAEVYGIYITDYHQAGVLNK